MMEKIRNSFFCIFIMLAACDSNVETLDGSNPVALSKDPKVLIESAKDKQRIGAYDEAIEILNAAVIIDPKFISAFNRMGLVYFEADKKNESVEAFKKAIAIDPENLNSRLGLGKTYSMITRNDLAVEQYLKAAKIKPNDLDILFKIALEYWYHQNLEQSKEYYNKVLEIDPSHIQTHLNLISVYESLEDWKKAIREIEISRQLGKEKNDSTAISIAERKKKFIIGRMNLTEEEYQRKTLPPFD
ncbi:MAG: tetratricopeptide repeat protein [Nitrospina sp.]|jgi:tetratricopeptide (TPR) repeat protein|nr:tetratricopeptide repeat protein [Nitrospina sp.]